MFEGSGFLEVTAISSDLGVVKFQMREGPELFLQAARRCVWQEGFEGSGLESPRKTTLFKGSGLESSSKALFFEGSSLDSMRKPVFLKVRWGVGLGIVEEIHVFGRFGFCGYTGIL